MEKNTQKRKLKLKEQRTKENLKKARVAEAKKEKRLAKNGKPSLKQHYKELLKFGVVGYDGTVQWNLQRLEAYATSMCGISMNKGKIKNRGKMWHSEAPGKSTPIDERLNSKRHNKNTGKYLGFKK